MSVIRPVACHGPRAALGALVTAFMLAACATTGPSGTFAVIDGTDWDRSEPYAAPVQIMSIDGKDYLRLHRRALAPGKHTVVFATTQVLRANRLRQVEEVELDLKPCTSYHYYAKHPSKFDSRWELKLLHEVKLEHCGTETP